MRQLGSCFVIEIKAWGGMEEETSRGQKLIDSSAAKREYLICGG